MCYYLNPVFREMEFITDDVKRVDFRSKAEEFSRKLVRKHKEKICTHSLSRECINIETTFPEHGSNEQDVSESTENLAEEIADTRRIRGKKRLFDLLLCADSVPTEVTIMDKVSNYNLLRVNHLPETSAALMRGDFSIMHFWYNRKSQFPNLYAVAARIFATPVSSAASERVFSALKILVDEQQSSLGTSLVRIRLLLALCTM